MKQLTFLILLLISSVVFSQQNTTELIRLGNELNKGQKFEQAIATYLKTIKILELKKDSIKLAKVYTDISIINAKLKYFDKAILYLEKSNSFIKNNQKLQLKNLYTLSGFYFDSKQYDKSFETLKESEKLANEINDDKILSSIYNSYCNYYRDHKKDYKKSIHYGLKSYELKNKIGTNTDIILNNIGYSYLQNKNFKNAISYLSKVENTKNKQLQLYVFNNLKHSYKGINKNKIALDYASKYIYLKDSIVKASQKLKVTSIIEKYEAHKKQQEINNLQINNDLQQSEIKTQQYLISGLIVLLLLISLLIFVWYKNNITKQSLEKETIKHKLLQTQLNPHFIFHSLNSIQTFIYQNRPEESINYLANYSKLMRSVFNSSDKDFITIEEDLNSIDNYTKLQNLNYENVVFHINSDNDIEMYKIPPLFIQPFVENALQHGVSNSENGEIHINYKDKNNLLKVEIIDNGKGYKPSKSKNNLNNLSSGDVIKKRIDNLKKTHKYYIETSIKPLDKGIMVSVYFPKKV